MGLNFSNCRNERKRERKREREGNDGVGQEKYDKRNRETKEGHKQLPGGRRTGAGEKRYG